MRKRTYGIILFFSVIIAVIFCLLYRIQSIGVIVSAALEQDNSILYLDNQNELYHIDVSGKILMREKLPRKEGELRLSYQNITSDINGNIYFMVLAKEEGKTVKAWVEERSAQGKLLRRILETEQEKNGKSLYTIQIVDGKLAVFSLNTNENKLMLDLYDLETKKQTAREYLFEEAPVVSWLKYTETGSIYYIDEHNGFCCLDNRSLGTYQYEIASESYGLEKDLADCISSDNAGNVYYCDIYHMKWVKYDEKADTLSVVYKKENKIDDTLTYGDIYNAKSVNGKLFAYLNAISFGDTGFYIKDGETSYILLNQYYSLWRVALCFFFVGVISFFLLLGIFYCGYRIKKMHSILAKQITAMAVILLFGIGGLSIGIRYYFYIHMLYEAYEELYILSKNMAVQIDGGYLSKIKLPMEINDPFYDTIQNQWKLDMDEFNNMFGEIVTKDFYYNVYVTQDNVDYLIQASDSSKSVNYRGLSRYMTDANAVIDSSLYNEDKSVRFEIVEGDGSVSLYCLYDIKDAEGNTAGRAETGFEYTYFYESINRILYRFIVIFVLVMAALMAVLAIQSRRNLRGLRKLYQGVSEILEGNWNTIVDINSQDELEEIANAFNRMSRELGVYMQSIEKMNVAYEKFVPQEAILLLEKKVVSDLAIGESITRDMVVLTVDIGNLYQINESMTSAQTFAFTNWLYGTIASEAAHSGGMIEKYMEAGLRALYFDAAEYSIDGALKMMEKVRSVRGDIEIHILVQKGSVIYGVAGTEEKAEAVAVSEILNYTYMLREMAQSNSIALLVTATVYESIVDKTRYHMRYIGKLKYRTDEKISIALYDVLDAYIGEEKNVRLRTKSMFEEGVYQFQSGNLKEARKHFIDVLRMDRQDMLAQNYLFLCDRWMHNLPEGFEGYFNGM